MAKKSKVKSVEVYVSYKGHHNVTKDKAITEVFGRSEVGSGYNLMNGTRDLHFSFSTRKAAEKAAGKPSVFFTPTFVKGKAAIEKLIEQTKGEGREGVIITRLDKPDYDVARIKVKHLQTYNLRVARIIQEEDKNGKLKPSMGAMALVDTTGREVCQVGGGFSHALRKEIWENQKLWVGKLIQVRAMAPTAEKLRSPQYNGDADGDIDTVPVV